MSRSPRVATAALCSLAVGALALGLLSAPSASGAGTAAAAAPPAPTGAPSAAATRHRVTLITGDVVTVTEVGGKKAVSVDRAKGSTGIIRTQTIGKDLYVMPEEALPYVAADRLDSRLFDVTQLIADGYDDESRGTTPLIVAYADGVDASKTAAPTGASRSAVLSSIGGAALSADKSDATAFWNAITPTTVGKTPAFSGGIATIYLDGLVKADLAEDVAQVKAPQAWAKGFDGTGTKVAVLDTGIDAKHPDLAGQVDTAISFVPGEDTLDYYGHGTHVASTIAGTGAASDGVEKGVAPGAHLLVGKVLGNDGSGQESWIISGMQWAANHARVVNMSLGSQEPSNGMDDPMDLAVNSLSAQTGSLFVIAAGNQGASGWINSPGAADDALTVGAVDASDQLAWFSSTGPRIDDSAIKPDIVAPGDNILAARSEYSSEGEGYYTTMSGTSMATPHVAGAAAILEQRHPNWSGEQLKDALMSGADGVSDPSPYDVGTGRLNVQRAVLGKVTASGARFFGLVRWPNAKVDPITRSITYTNGGNADVTLSLSMALRDQNGAAAPKGAFTLGTKQVTLPAKGTKVVKVTAVPNKLSAGSRYAGTVVASVDGTSVARTSVAIDKEAELYNLDLNVTGRDGQPATTWVTVRKPGDEYPIQMQVTGSQTLRLPADTYSVMGWMEVNDGPDAQGLALVGSPQVHLDQDQTVQLDASKAVPVKADVGKRTEASFREMEYYTATADGSDSYDETAMPFVTEDTMYAQPTAPVEDGSFEFVTRWRLRKPSMIVKAGPTVLDTIQQVGAPWLKGTSSVGAVYAGSGTDSEYDGIDATGKAVVVTRSDSVSMYDQSLTASEHGAVFLLVVNNAAPEFSGWAGGPNGETAATPVAGISGLQGADVIAKAQKGNLTLSTSGGMNSPWIYDLVDPHDGSIPSNLTYAPATSDLATLTEQYAAKKAQLGGEFRFQFRPQTEYGTGFGQYIKLPSTRTEYVSAQPDTQWYQGITTINGQWDLRGIKTTYAPGQQLTERWFTPVVYPRLGEGFWGPNRQYDFIQVNLPMWGDSGTGRTGSMTNDDGTNNQVIKIYDGDTLLKETDGWQSAWIELPAGKKQYRVTSVASRSQADWGTSTKVSSDYTFWTEHNDGTTLGLLPFVQVGFDVDTDLDGNAAAGTKATIGFTSWQLPDVVDGGRIAGGKLSVSYDEGKTWSPLSLTGKVGNWKAKLTYPADASKWVSLKASAWDDAGNSASQTIIRAYGLR